MATLKDFFQSKISKMSDKTIMDVVSAIKHHKDWRNFGNNEQRLFCEEAHKRGLLV